MNNIVKIHDPMGLVESANEGRDCVRSFTVSHTISRSKDLSGQYTGGKQVVVSRSMQRLSLLLSVEEQFGPVEVVGFRVVKKNISFQKLKGLQ